MGMAIDNPDRFYNLASGLSVTPEPLPNTLAGPELQFVRDVIAQSNTYSSKIHEAGINAPNTGVAYDGDSLSSQLKVVARLINGGLETSIYVVTLAGFDTHNQQAPVHASRLSYVARAVKAFLDDVSLGNNADRVVCMTYSEFGRRVNENGSQGTDHGAASPQFVVGKGVLGGQVIGGAPDLVNLDNRGDIMFKNDFRQIYASVLQDWLGFSPADTNTVLGGNFQRLHLFENPAFDAPDESIARFAGVVLDQNTPNPVRSGTAITFHLPRQTRVRLDVIAADGRRVTSLVDRTLGAGEHRVALDASGLASGTYLYTLEAGAYTLSKTMVVTH
jgi:hypothetical protein